MTDGLARLAAGTGFSWNPVVDWQELTRDAFMREALLAGSGVHPVFPLWGRDTAVLAREMIASGLRATLVCVDTSKLSGTYAGRELGAQLLGELPATCDPCGENGEFHTFAWACPAFRAPVRALPGPVEERGGFAFADLVPAS